MRSAIRSNSSSAEDASTSRLTRGPSIASTGFGAAFALPCVAGGS